MSAWADNAGYVGGQVHTSATAYLAAASGTFSRASGAWRRDADKVWRKSASHQLRLHHDAGGDPLGVLIEGQRTSSLWPSRNLTDAGWVKRGTCTVTQDMAVARPDGTPGAMRIEGLDIAANDVYRSLGGGPASQSYAPQIMLRRVSTSGTLAFQSPIGLAFGYWNIDLSLLPDAWALVTRTHPAVSVVNEFVTNEAGAYGIQIHTSVAGSRAVYADFTSAELANVLWASSPMDPSAGAVTRLADALSYPASFGSEGTVVVRGRTAPGVISTSQHIFSAGDASNSIRIQRDNARNVAAIVVEGGVNRSILSLGTVADDTPIAVAFSWKSGQQAASLNGGAAVTGSYAGTMPALSTAYEGGYAGSSTWFGTVGRLSLYDRAYAGVDLPGMLS